MLSIRRSLSAKQWLRGGVTTNRQLQERVKEEEEEEEVDVDSYVCRGRSFENLVVSTFGQFGMRLETRGGPADRGLDFSGTWLSGRIQVAGQCKHSKHRVASRWLREFEGALEQEQGRVADVDNVLGLFVCSSGYTDESVVFVDRGTRRPIVAAIVEPDTGKLMHVHANEHAHALLGSVDVSFNVAYRFEAHNRKIIVRLTDDIEQR
jgi:Restriction endonuclease